MSGCHGFRTIGPVCIPKLTVSLLLRLCCFVLLLQRVVYCYIQLQASRSSHAMLLNLSRLHRALSSFNHVTHSWAAIPLRGPQDTITQRPSSQPADAIGKQSLSLTSWNIQPSQSARSHLEGTQVFRYYSSPRSHFQDPTISPR